MEFLDALVEVVPYRLHTVPTDNGTQFADLPKNRKGPAAMMRGHPFDRACARHGIEHRLTKPNHPWTNGQVERMNRTIKDAPPSNAITLLAVRTLFYWGDFDLAGLRKRLPQLRLPTSER